ncbi:metallophosphoesterase 1 [Plakobranchus ocellatus]|uniref:Metallophosphoesterase 1 n=1 Tax=Plakobranchus ocellatus TaxID=259542 RepID=A0AAV4DKU4_9GAST|nr:metallophosphoesterase 1 [Plakobranchus ocellatus]
MFANLPESPESLNLLGNKEEEMVALFVADPQLIGIQDEMGFPIGALARWDSDRYLRNSFSRVYEHTQPDVIVFLGDLLDEGSKAFKDEYLSYVERFNSIFYEKKYSKTIVIAGDNDIGGEGADMRTPFKVARFEKHFDAIEGVVNHMFVDFIKLDIRYGDVEARRQAYRRMVPTLKAPFRIIINHESVMTRRKENVYPILKFVQPHAVISAHWHWSHIYSCATCLEENEDLSYWPYYERDSKNNRGFEEIDLTQQASLDEIMVPTCSYRMGVPYMGYGVAIINKSGLMKYTVLWLPSRYPLLYIYAAVLLVSVILLCFEFIFSSGIQKQIFS